MRWSARWILGLALVAIAVVVGWKVTAAPRGTGTSNQVAAAQPPAPATTPPAPKPDDLAKPLGSPRPPSTPPAVVPEARPPALPTIPAPTTPLPALPVLPDAGPMIPVAPAAPATPPSVAPVAPKLPSPPDDIGLPVPALKPNVPVTPPTIPEPAFTKIEPVPPPADPRLPGLPALPAAPGNAGTPPAPPRNFNDEVRTFPAPAAGATKAITPIATAPEGSSPVYVNAKRVAIDYEVTKKGASGLGSVELWLKDANGWSKLTTAKSGEALEYDLPADGVYGAKVVAVSGQGVRGAAPGKDTAPDLWVVLDTAKPKVEMKVTPVPVRDKKTNAAFVIEVGLSDANIDCEKVAFFWHTEESAKETVVNPLFTGAELAKGKVETKIGTFSARPTKPTEGSTVCLEIEWTPSDDVPAKLGLGAKAQDRAGNSTSTVHTLGTDLTEPAAKVTAIRAAPSK